MNIEDPSTVISSATAAVSKAVSYAADKLGPVATKTIEVVGKQVYVDLWTTGVFVVLFAIIAAILGKVCWHCRATSKTFGERYTTDIYEPTAYITGILSVVFMLLTAGFTIYFFTCAPTVMFNPEYATAAKVCELLSLLKSQ